MHAQGRAQAGGGVHAKQQLQSDSLLRSSVGRTCSAGAWPAWDPSAMFSLSKRSPPQQHCAVRLLGVTQVLSTQHDGLP